MFFQSKKWQKYQKIDLQRLQFVTNFIILKMCHIQQYNFECSYHDLKSPFLKSSGKLDWKHVK